MRSVKVMLVVLSMILVCSVANAETFRFTASADNRPYDSTNLSRWEWLLDEMTDKVGDEGVFHIMPGDFDDPQTTDATLKTQFGSDVVWYPVVGNHEAETADDMTWIRNASGDLPYVVNWGPSGCQTTTYSFDYGNAHFVAINEYYDGTSDTGTDGDVVDALYEWLVDDLAANTKPAVFVIGHEPAYPEYAHVGDSLDGHEANRDRFWKLLNDNQVIAYLCGHTHWYYAKQVDGADWEPFTWQIDCGNAGNPRELEQTFVDVAVTDTDVTFTAWQGLEGNSYTVRETWTVEIPFVAASNPSPADGATGVLPASVALSATVENPSGTADPVDVDFFGRENPTFSIVVLPDTQNYVNLLDAGTPEIFTSQTQWIADNAATMNTVFVTHEGDITDNTDRPEQGDVPAEWERANTSMSLLDGVAPYGLLPGNHDYPTTYFNTYFPYTRYDSESWYGGHYGTTNDNSYQLFSAGGDDYIILHIEYNPGSTIDDPVIAWADGVLKANADRIAIITTHAYLDANGNRTSEGTGIWNVLVQGNDNVYFVLCGHVSAEAMRTDLVGGREVHQLLANYQGRANGGDGWLRIMTFDPDADEVYVQTYSPWLDDSETDTNSDFVLAFDMTSTEYSLIGSQAGVASGSTASTTWTSLAMETQYEWYVTVADTGSAAILPGPVWDFTTASLKASNPDPANGATGIDVDADLSWSAGIDAVSHDVYFGTDAASLPLVSAEQPGITYDPGTLDQGVTYYWAIDEHDSGEDVTAGDVWSFTTAVPPPLTFQQGVDGYSAMVDTMIRWATPDNNYDDSATEHYGGYQYQYNADTSSDGGPSQVLMRFDDIIGSNAGQIPAGSTIVSATLRICSTDDGNGGNAHAMLQSWVDSEVTWNDSFGGDGIQADDNEAAAVEDDGVSSNSPDTDVDLDVTATVQAWADGTAVNNGWAILPNGTNGWHMAAAEHPTLDYRPELIVSFITTGPRPPVADAGADQTVGDSDGDDGETVTLDGSDSYDPDGSITAYEWDIDGDQITDHTGVTVPDVPFGLGAHTITLTVTDDEEATDSDDVVITVNANQAPLADAGSDQTLTDSDENGSETVTLDGSASSDPDGTILSYEWDIDGDQVTDYTGETVLDVQLGVGVHNITLTVTDNGGATASDDVTVTITQPDYDAYVSQSPIVTYGLVEGGIEGTTTAGDGLVQTITEVTNAAKAVLQVEYVLTTNADPTSISSLQLYLDATWTDVSEGGDNLSVQIWNGSGWTDTDITGDMGGSFTPAYPQDYVDAGGNIRVLFTDTVAVKREIKDVLTIDRLYADISAGPVNQPPVANDDAHAVDEDDTLSVPAIGVLVNDTDPESNPLTAVLIGDVSNGMLSLNSNGSFNYTPNANFNSSDSFTYAANDGVSNSNTATVTITVNPINDAPVANNDSATTNEDTAVVIDVLANDTDVDPTDTLSVQSVTEGANGSVANNGDSVTYTPGLGFVGDDTFSYTVSDGNAGTDTATVSVTVTEFNNPPVANDDSATTDEDTAVIVDVLANDTDADVDDTLSVQSATNGSNGSVVNNGDSVTYTPNANFNGTDVFTYTVSDGKGGTDTGSVTVTVLAVNDPPSAGDDSAATDEDTAVVVDVLANDSDIDGDTLTIDSVTQGVNGSVVKNGGSVTYTPDTGFTGEDSFTYIASDGNGGTAEATVTVTVDPATLSVHVAAIDVTAQPDGRKYNATTTVTLAPQFAGATVVGDWYFKGVVRATGQTATTDAGGTATFTSFTTPGKSGDTFKFVVTNVTATGYTYDEASNVVTSGSDAI